MKALTVQQPWAWAIIHGSKTVENRTQRWKYRGPLAIHAGMRLSERGCMQIPEIIDQTRPDLLAEYAETELVYGAIIGVVQMVDCHTAEPGCCETPWAEYLPPDPWSGRDVTHLVLADPRPVDPIPCKGALGLWTVPDHVEQQLARPVS